jgi:hypothetical protein
MRGNRGRGRETVQRLRAIYRSRLDVRHIPCKPLGPLSHPPDRAGVSSLAVFAGEGGARKVIVANIGASRRRHCAVGKL